MGETANPVDRVDRYVPVAFFVRGGGVRHWVDRDDLVRADSGFEGRPICASGKSTAGDQEALEHFMALFRPKVAPPMIASLRPCKRCQEVAAERRPRA